MNQIYPITAKGKALFYLAGIVCIFTLFGIPFAIVFFYMATKAKIELTDDALIYQMLSRKVIPYIQIEEMRFLRHMSVGHVAVGQLAYVVPIQISWGGGRKTKFSFNFFENSDKILEFLIQKTGKQIVN